MSSFFRVFFVFAIVFLSFESFSSEFPGYPGFTREEILSKKDEVKFKRALKEGDLSAFKSLNKMFTSDPFARGIRALFFLKERKAIAQENHVPLKRVEVLGFHLQQVGFLVTKEPHIDPLVGKDLRTSGFGFKQHPDFPTYSMVFVAHHEGEEEREERGTLIYLDPETKKPLTGDFDSRCHQLKDSKDVLVLGGESDRGLANIDPTPRKMPANAVHSTPPEARSDRFIVHFYITE